MEDALVRSDIQQLSALLDHFPVAISRLDRNLRYLYANRAAARIFGVAQDSMIGRTKAEIGTLPADIYRPWDQKCRSVLLSGKHAIHGFQCMTRDGPRHYSVRIQPEFDRDGAVAAIFSIANDVTAHKRTEEALQRSEQQRRQAERALQRSDEERARLLEREQILRLQAEAVTGDAQAAGRMKDEFLANLSRTAHSP
jgi:PAS domain S-box-containing protein